MNDLYFILVNVDSVIVIDSLIVPYLYLIVSTSSCNKTKIVCIVSTNDLLTMTILFSSPYSSLVCLTVLVKVDHYGSIPSH